MIGSLRGPVTHVGPGLRRWSRSAGSATGWWRRPTLLARLRLGSEAHFFVHHLVREDQQALFGFASSEELAFFELLMTVTGVGPRLALAIMGAHPVTRLQLGDRDRRPGPADLGQRRRAARLPSASCWSSRRRSTPPASRSGPGATSESDVVAALESLGYTTNEARRAAGAVAGTRGRPRRAHQGRAPGAGTLAMTRRRERAGATRRWRAQILETTHVWAVVGCSPDPMRASYGVSRTLMAYGYEMIPIYPRETTIHGIATAPDLATAAADRPAGRPDRGGRHLPCLASRRGACRRGDRHRREGGLDAARRLGRGSRRARRCCRPAGRHESLPRHRPAFAARGVKPSIRRGRPEEAPALRALAHRSKAHWPYTPEFLALVEPMLQLEPEDVAAHEVWVLDLDGITVGWHRVTGHGDRAELEDLWLEPPVIGTGLGRVLFQHAVGVAADLGATRMEWDAEPYAVGFYRAMGGEEIGSTPSAAEPGRMLPRMSIGVGQRGTRKR